MDHLNYFVPYQSRMPGHEDQLTRAFLVILRFVPLAQAAFFDLVRAEQLKCHDCKHIIPLFSELATEQMTIETQVTTISQQTGILISIAITDADQQQDSSVGAVQRDARYDGVISYRPEWILLLENKPYDRQGGDASRQMNPNLGATSEVVVEKRGITMPWRAIIGCLNGLLRRQLIHGAERLLIEDFLLYVDTNFVHLNPFGEFSQCKEDEYLLRRRCCNIMEAIAPGHVDYHRGWKHGIVLPSGAVREIYLYPEVRKDSDWQILLGMYACDTVAQSREFFGNVKSSKFLGLVNGGWTITPNMHFAFMSTNLVWVKPSLGAENYFKFWLENQNRIRQERRDVTEFHSFFESLKGEGLIADEDMPKLDDKFTQTKRNSINVCPGLSISFRWTRDEACELDAKGEFVDAVRSRIEEALSTWDQTLPVVEQVAPS
jgi:hypothetical protein